MQCCSSEDGSGADCPRTRTCLWVLQIFRLGNLRAVSHLVSHATCPCEWVPGDSHTTDTPSRKQGRADPENPALVSACHAVAECESCCSRVRVASLLPGLLLLGAPPGCRGGMGPLRGQGCSLVSVSFKGQWRLA